MCRGGVAMYGNVQSSSRIQSPIRVRAKGNYVCIISIRSNVVMAHVMAHAAHTGNILYVPSLEKYAQERWRIRGLALPL